MSGKTEKVGMAEFYVEVMHMRGNFTKFEYELDGGVDGEVIELDVWDFRRRDHMDWHVGFEVTKQISATAGAEPLTFKITRYPDLEKDVLDSPYHPSVESWNIDLEKVKEHFIGNDE